MRLKVWFAETRPQFLLLSVVLAFLGTAIAWYDGYFHLGYALLAFLGLLLCHIGVNVLNDYFDYKSGIDLKTKRTPFSGGSGILPAAQMKPRQVFWLGMGSFLLAIPIGVYFVIVAGWALLPLLLVAAFCTLLYTPLLTRIGWPEWAPGAGMGTLPVLGMYFIQASDYTGAAVVAAIPSGILVHNLDCLFRADHSRLRLDSLLGGGGGDAPLLLNCPAHPALRPQGHLGRAPL
jgi:1,4-dihydroxy-2-naphthoate octaprenyltransferase